ncbi:MAG: hypothetical protein J7L86_03350 [Candidatus Marinimicrobia bacterium]|nr:hypothetical protein [Candidatus Neomarinimicrobiota bacterium]
MSNYALYYPTIEFRDYSWLWSASLLWDKIYRIVPKDYTPEDPENVRILAEAGDIGVPIHPDNYAKKIAKKFIEKIYSGEWEAAALEFDIDEAYQRIHHDKVDVELRNMIIAKGQTKSHGDWLYVPTEFEALYMTYLAERISCKNNLQLLSDSSAAWTGSTFFKYDGEVQDFPYEDQTQQLATLVIRDFIPNNILEITPESIIKFREKYRDERQRFIQAIRRAAKAISDSDDENIYRDRIEDLKKDIESALSDYRGSMQALNVAGWTGIKSLSFPVVTKVATAISGGTLDTTTLMVISALGVGVGLVSGLTTWKEKRRQLNKDSDYSYLIHLQRNWKHSAMYNNDYNYMLCREMEEFIND